MIGYLSKSIELKVFNTGNMIANSAIAVSKVYVKDNGNKESKTCFIDIVLFGNVAKNANTYLKKGSHVAISGELQYEQWQSSDGKFHSKHSIAVDTLQFLDKKPQDENNKPKPNTSTTNATTHTNTKRQEDIKKELQVELETEIPF